MSLNEEFDELARRKLEERQVAFQEADWQAARKLIDAERGGRNRAAWIAGALVLLLISGLVWYGANSTGTKETVAAIEQITPLTTEAIAADQPVQNTSATATVSSRSSREEAPPKANEPAAVLTAKAAATTDVQAPSIQSIPVHPLDRATEAPAAANATAKKPTPRKSVEMNTSGGDQPKAVSSKKEVPHNTHAAIPEVKSNKATSPSETAVATPGVQTATPSLAGSGKASHQDGAIDPEVKAAQQNTTGSNAASLNVADQPDGPVLPMEPNSESDELPALRTQGRTDEVAIVVAPPTIASTEGPFQPQAALTPSSIDTAATATVAITLPDDSVTAAVAAATPPPLVPERAPWEVSILGGMFSSTTKYSGSNSTDWNAGIGKENSAGAGAELMHMGRNFGIGTGLHYSTYAEQLRVGALDRSTTTLQNFWYLMTVDTMVLVITDTIAGTPPTYIGTSENTTVNMLTQGIDTVTTTERIREARNEMNRVSYSEVPLLLDAHLVQGRWSFGLRGGPTVGLLTGRRGSLPSPDNEGYVSFTDQPFRELVFGYTARAYVRYRFNAAWSVGIEPAMRGQMMNSLGSGELSRRASAKGVMLSLSYRLR